MTDAAPPPQPEATAEEMKRRLDRVQDEIDQAEDKAEAVTAHHEQAFIDPGKVGTEQTDDAIVPPG